MAKLNIHPKYFQTKIICITCLNHFITGSTKNQEIRVDTCSCCHPFYTGKKSFISIKGRIERFNSKINKQIQKNKKPIEINKKQNFHKKTILLETAKDILQLKNNK